MEDLLPEAVLVNLRDHYYAGVKAAEIGYEHNAADEDSVTGALGQALLTPGITQVFVDGQTYAWRAYHTKIRGRGPGAPENAIGADGIFQLEVFDRENGIVRRKGLLFQAKNEWKRTDRRLLEQARQLAQHSPSAVVVDYSRNGFKAVGVGQVVEARGSPRKIRLAGEPQLAQVLGDDFVRCRRGDIGMYWDAERELLTVNGVRVLPDHVMGTVVQRIA